MAEHRHLIDLRSKEQLTGQNVLHLVIQTNYGLGIAQQIYELDSELCLLQDYYGYSPFYLACQLIENLDYVKVFQDYRAEAMLQQDYRGFNILHECAKINNVKTFMWLYRHSTTNDFFRARGMQTYEGQTMEHVACLYENIELCADIRPKFDVKDYYGNLPLHYAIMRNDTPMVKKYFMKSKHFFDAQNFKNETIFHIAAKYNSVDSLCELLGKSVFLGDLLKKNYIGDTPIHVAAKAGNLDIL